SLGDRQGYLPVDEIVIEGDPGGIFAGVGIIDGAETSPINSRQAHGTRLTTGVEIAFDELKCLQRFASVANGGDFCVSSRVVRRGDLIAAASDDFAVSHDYRAKRAALAAAHHLEGETNGRAHELLLHGNSSPMFVDREICLP